MMDRLKNLLASATAMLLVGIITIAISIGMLIWVPIRTVYQRLFKRS